MHTIWVSPSKTCGCSGSRDWQEDFSDTVVQLFADTDFARSLALWDTIGDDLGRWQAHQSQRLCKILAEDFTVFVEAHADTA